MSMRLTAVVMGLCMAATLSMAHADVYKWTDANGRVHYGDRLKTARKKLSRVQAQARAKAPRLRKKTQATISRSSMMKTAAASAIS